MQNQWARENGLAAGVALAVGVSIGMFLSLWLSSRVVERLLSKLTSLTNEVVRETGKAMNPPPEQAVTQPGMYSTAALPNDIDPDSEMPPWAMGMTWDDLRKGTDPWGDRPLR